MNVRLPHTSLVFLLLLCCSALIAGCQTDTPQLHGSVYDPPRPAPQLELQKSAGGTYQLSQNLEKSNLPILDFASCPDICPATLAEERSFFQLRGEQANEVGFEFISVDPAVSTEDQLASHVQGFDPRFISLNGYDQALQDIKSQYGFVAERDPGADETNQSIIHTARIFLIDPNGVLHTNYTFGTPQEEILADLHRLLER